MAKTIHTGLHAEVAVGYLWSVFYLTAARDEAMAFLTEEQYAHVTDLMRALAAEADPRRPKTVDVEAVEDWHELKDKGAILGRINLRVYFTVENSRKALLVLGAIKKEADGKMPEWAKIRIRNRLRRFRRGEYGSLP
ncbi:MAG: hypothetical protein ACKVW3_01580 [Phycisphaerales bacterium]